MWDKMDMTMAVVAWLESREQWLHGAGSVCLDNFKNATNLLYVAFLEDSDFSNNSRISGEAFYKFRNFLEEEFDKEIPHRKRFHLNPTIVGHA